MQNSLRVLHFFIWYDSISLQAKYQKTNTIQIHSYKCIYIPILFSNMRRNTLIDESSHHYWRHLDFSRYTSHSLELYFLSYLECSTIVRILHVSWTGWIQLHWSQREMKSQIFSHHQVSRFMLLMPLILKQRKISRQSLKRFSPQIQKLYILEIMDLKVSYQKFHKLHSRQPLLSLHMRIALWYLESARISLS